MKHTCSIALAGLVAWGLAGDTAWAQFQAPLNSLEYTDDGTVEAVQENAIKIRDSKNDDWILEINGETMIQVTGEAEREWLKPGVFVKFTGEIDKKGVLQKDVEEIEIITAADKSSLGLFTPSEGDAPSKAVRNPGSGSYVIKGRLTKVQDGKILVLAGSRQVMGRTGRRTEGQARPRRSSVRASRRLGQGESLVLRELATRFGIQQAGARAGRGSHDHAGQAAGLHRQEDTRSVDKSVKSSKPASKSSRVAK